MRKTHAQRRYASIMAGHIQVYPKNRKQRKTLKLAERRFFKATGLRIALDTRINYAV